MDITVVHIIIIIIKHSLTHLSGRYGKNGALSIFQNSIRPMINSTFDLPTVYNMWTIHTDPTSNMHSYLILAKADSTLVLQTGVLIGSK